MSDTYTEGDMRAAYEAGYDQALYGVWYADSTTPIEPEMFGEWIAGADRG